MKERGIEALDRIIGIRAKHLKHDYRIIDAVKRAEKEPANEDGENVHEDVHDESTQRDNPEHLLTSESPESLLVKKQLVELMNVVLKTLPKKEQVVLRMRFYKDKTQEEVGKVLHLTHQGVQKIEERALRKLRLPSRAKDLLPFVEGGKTGATERGHKKPISGTLEDMGRALSDDGAA